MLFNQRSLHNLKLKSGDIVLFSGEDWSSSLIRFVTNSEWSHVGMVVLYKGELCLFEAAGPYAALSLKKALMGKVQVKPLDEALNSYKGSVAIRHLHSPLSEPQLYTLDQTVRKYIGVAYEKNIGELLKSAVDAPKWWSRIPLVGKLVDKLTKNKENTTSIFCSELVALTYRNLGFSLSSLPVNEFTPEDLASTSKYKPFRGYRVLSKEIIFIDARESIK